MKIEDLILPYTVGTVSDDYIASVVRNYRNLQLAASDWTQLPDVDLANKSDWTVYRQALRDLTQQGADPKLWVFPVPPT